MLSVFKSTTINDYFETGYKQQKHFYTMCLTTGSDYTERKAKQVTALQICWVAVEWKM